MKADEGTMSFEDRRLFAEAVLEGLGAEASDGNVEILLAWMAKENTGARNNPFATTWGKTSGYEPYNENNGNPVWHYPDFKTGVANTVKTLTGKNRYTNIVTALKEGSDLDSFLANEGIVNELKLWGTLAGLKEGQTPLLGSRTGFVSTEESENTFDNLSDDLIMDMLKLRYPVVEGHSEPNPPYPYWLDVLKRGGTVDQIDQQARDLGYTVIDQPGMEQNSGLLDEQVMPDSQESSIPFSENEAVDLVKPYVDALETIKNHEALQDIGDAAERVAELLIFNDETKAGWYTYDVALDQVNAVLSAVEGSSLITDDQRQVLAGIVEEASRVFAPQGTDFTGLNVGEPDWEAEFGYMMDLINHPEIGQIVKDCIENDCDLETLQGKIWSTEWWSTREDAAASFELLEMWSPAEATAQIDDKKNTILSEAQRLKVTISPSRLAEMARNSIIESWSDSEISSKILAEEKWTDDGPDGGAIGAHMQDIKELVGDYYVTHSPTEIEEMAKKIYLGSDSLQGVGAHFANMAKSRFPSLAPMIDQGYTVKNLFDPYVQEIGKWLEIPTTGINLAEDMRFKPIIDHTGADGEHRPMSLYEMGQYVRTLPEWQTTNNAKTSARNLADFVAKKFGSVG